MYISLYIYDICTFIYKCIYVERETETYIDKVIETTNDKAVT